MPAKIDGRKRAAVIRFIAKFGGHGAISAASRKFEVSRVTIMRWLKGEPTVKGKAKVGRPPKAAVKSRKPRKVRKVVKVAKAPIVTKVGRRRGRPAKGTTNGMKAFAEGLVAIAELQAEVGEAMKRLAAFVG